MKNVLKLLLLVMLMVCGSIKGFMMEVVFFEGKIFLSDIYCFYFYFVIVIDVYDGDIFILDFEIGFSLCYEDVI